MRLALPSLSVLMLAWPPQPMVGQSSLAASVVPRRPIIERTSNAQILNFDLVIENVGPRRLLDRIELSVFDRNDQLAIRKYVGHHGVSPGILTIPKLAVDSGGRLGVFNPFFSFDQAVDLARLRYTLSFTTEAGAPAGQVDVDVRPVDYQPKAALRIPLERRTLVYDGHDFYSHHRRVDVGHPFVKQMGLEDNPVRYANDLCIVDDQNRLHRGDSGKIEEWFSFGASVVAPADGIVVVARNDVPENRIENGKLVYPADMPADGEGRATGNSLVIDHGQGEFSHMAHLKRGSLTVRVGDRVRRGQQVGAIGFSGDTGFHVHLHYGLMTGKEYLRAQPLPAYFTGFRRILGSRTVAVERGSIDSGDLLLPGRP